MTGLQSVRPTSIAVAAMGGQGGGVLSNWIVDLAENNGYYAQVTSVPGVAQRTGATINYVEILPEAAAEAAGKFPVLALMPVAGDVDIVIAGELVEAGRAVQRGIVTPDRTTLIASSHRFYAIAEKSAMSDGRVDSQAIVKSVEKAARAFYCFDMEALAQKHNTVISAVLFGALAGSGALEFGEQDYLETIRRGGKAIDASIAGFKAGLELAKSGNRDLSEEVADGDVGVDTDTSRPLHPGVQALLERLETELPAASGHLAREGIRRLIDYQDPKYANTYIDRLVTIYEAERDAGGNNDDWALTTATARHLALWMSYEDTIRVADLKTRSARFTRYRNEVRANEDQIVHVTEFMHPRVEEISDTLPNWLGSAIMSGGLLHRVVGKLFSNPWKVKTSKLWGFLLLYPLGRMKILRRGSYRFKREEQAILEWMQRITEASKSNLALANEIVLCQKLVKGYGDTHARGWKNYSTIMTTIDETGLGKISADRVAALREAALADEHGDALREELQKAA